MDKIKLRKKYLNIRTNIKNREDLSNIIMNKVINDSWYKSANVIAFYNSFGSEVNTKAMIEYSLNNGKTVALPKVFNNELEFYQINSLNDKFIKSSLGVEEPLPLKDNYVDSNNIDLFIVPGVCFDKANNRLGYGKGFYDRLLKNTKAKVIAICFEDQVLKSDKISVDDYDIKIPKIITDKNIYTL